jgi:hypothetical protein
MAIVAWVVPKFVTQRNNCQILVGMLRAQIPCALKVLMYKIIHFHVLNSLLESPKIPRFFLTRTNSTDSGMSLLISSINSSYSAKIPFVKL